MLTMDNKAFNSSIAGLAVVAACGFGSQGWAQASAETGEVLAEIVVTANKRQESLSDVGLTVNVVSGDALKNRHVKTLQDLAATVPNLTFQPTAFATPVFTIRGVGFFDSSLSSYPAVSTYIDEFALPFPVLTAHVAYDLERMEVMKGPQGTLFGASATGGAINFIAAKPTDAVETGADLSYGRFNRIDGEAYVSGPLSESLKARVAMSGARADDWQKSYTTPNRTSGEERYLAARVLLDWQAAETLRLQANMNGYVDDSDTQAPQFVAVVPQTAYAATVSPGILAFPFSPRDARAAEWEDSLDAGVSGEPSGQQNMWQAAVRADWEAGSEVSLTALTSYAYYDRDMTTEQGGTPFIDTDYITKGDIRSLTQEVRVANAAANRIRWVAGANYERTNTSEFLHDFWRHISSAPIFFGYTGVRNETSQELRSYAGFANLEFDLTAAITVKGGARYTQANRRLDSCSYDPGDGTYNRVVGFVGNQIQLGQRSVPGFTPTGVPIIPIAVGDCAELDDVTFDGTPVSYQHSRLLASLKENNVSWRVGLDYKVHDDALLYLNVARGYKAGTFPFITGATQKQHVAVPQEELLNVEGGVKLQLPDHALWLNVAAFYYDYDDKQLRGKVPDPVFGSLNALVSVPRSHLQGIEIEANYRPLPGLSLGVALSHIESRIDEYVGYPALGPITDFAGARLPYLPEDQVMMSVDYVWSIAHLEAFFGASFSYRSEQDAAIGGSRGYTPAPINYRSNYPLSEMFTIDGYGLLDVRVGVRAPDNSWSVSLYGTNVTDEYYALNILPTYDTNVRYAGRPAMYGVAFSIRR